MKFRIKYLEGIGYFPQVKLGSIGWEKIVKYPNGGFGFYPKFGLYPESDISYPLDTSEDALQRCQEYKDWRALATATKKPLYIRVDI